MKYFFLLLTLCVFFVSIFFIAAGLWQTAPQLSLRAFPGVSPSPLSVSPRADVAGVERERAVVKKVIDGDTIELIDGRKVRYIGIDTPETVDPRRPDGCFGVEASNKNKELVLGQEIEMEKDVSDTDRFGRLLRYVYLQSGGEWVMVNQLLLEEGFASAATFPPDVKYQDLFLSTETESRSENKGLWGKCET